MRPHWLACKRWCLGHTWDASRMNHVRLLLGVIVVLVAVGPVMARKQLPTFPQYPHHDEVVKLAVSQNNFTRDLYVQIAQRSSRNLFFSPFSIVMAMGMTHAGTAGNTEKEVHAVLHLSQDKDAMHNAFQDIVTDLKTEAADYELRTSNMAYVSHKMTLLSNFECILKEKYLSYAKTVNFEESEKVKQEINDAVEKETNSRIKNLIPSGILDSLTRMVLVNAIYFKGLWENQFKKSDTHDQMFWLSESESVKIPMMNVKSDFHLKHNKDLDADILALDYKGSRLSMVLVLPTKRDGLAELEAKLATTDLNDLGKRMHKSKVVVTLPKFKLEESLFLNEHLAKMGIKDLFDVNHCDLSGITGTNDLYVSHVIHKAFLEVNEEGSEAAAATAVVIKMRSLPKPPHTFIADHPFFFCIRDEQSGFILFSGRFIHPEFVSSKDEL
ncbi:ipis-1 isoform X1 [Cherax quadricarinatus]|uniref:ipis-1 isoform X1 n=1 Tax=Cherax quadricarinatus TaxID=27406 RepID=UPI00387E3B12